MQSEIILSLTVKALNSVHSAVCTKQCTWWSGENDSEVNSSEVECIIAVNGLQLHCIKTVVYNKEEPSKGDFSTR